MLADVSTYSATRFGFVILIARTADGFTKIAHTVITTNARNIKSIGTNEGRSAWRRSLQWRNVRSARTPMQTAMIVSSGNSDRVTKVSADCDAFIARLARSFAP